MLGSLMSCSLEALVIDNDMLGSINRTIRGIEVDEETLSVEVIKEAVHGAGHYLGSQQTLDLMQRDYLYPTIGDRESPDNWLDAGGKDQLQVAQEHVHTLLKQHPTHLQPDRDKAIRDRFPIVLERPGVD